MENSAWVATYADRVAALKDHEGAGGGVADAIRTAFTSRVYRAVAFDVDGTLTSPHSPEIDPMMADIVGDLLSTGVPVALVTGRGRSVSQAINDIVERTRPAAPALQRLSAIIHNGVFLLNPHFTGRFDEERLIAPRFEGVEGLAQALEARLLEAGLSEGAALDRKDHSVRVVVSDDARHDDVEAIVRAVAAESEGDIPLYVSRGSYGVTASLDVAPTTKARALERYAAAIGVPPEAILRIGDQGAAGGNDHDLLDHPGGFSVGTWSRSPGTCHPVLDERLEQTLSGAAATRRLLALVILSAPLTLAPSSQVRERLPEQVRDAERRAAETSRTLWEAEGHRLWRVLRSRDLAPEEAVDLRAIFDPLSGAVRFREWEVEQLPPAEPAVRLLELDRILTCQGEPQTRRIMFSDTAILARGPASWPDWTSPDMPLAEFLTEAEEFLTRGIDGIASLGRQTPSLPLYKVTLAIADHVRNLLLQMCHASLTVCSGAEAVAFAHRVVVPHTNLMLSKLLMGQHGWEQAHEEYAQGLRKTHAALRDRAWSEALCSSEATVRGLCRYRECDNLLENVAAVRAGIRAMTEDRHGLGQITAAGLVYGGIELPIIAHCLTALEGGPTVDIAFMSLSLYSDMEAGDRIRSQPAGSVEELLARDVTLETEGGEMPTQPVVLMDDNCLTANTLQWGRDLLIARGTEVAGAIVVRYPRASRFAQMMLPRHGVVDPVALNTFIHGLVAASPYSRLVMPGGGASPYQDQTGVFDKAKERILRYLVKNGTPRRDEATP